MEMWREFAPNREVSTRGRIRSTKYRGSDKTQVLKTKIDRYGYEVVALSINGVMKDLKIHRLVAEAFLPNPDNLPTVNHKDGNKKNNFLSNLEWSSYTDNQQHAHDMGLFSRDRKHSGPHHADQVDSFTDR